MYEITFSYGLKYIKFMDTKVGGVGHNCYLLSFCPCFLRPRCRVAGLCSCLRISTACTQTLCVKALCSWGG